MTASNAPLVSVITPTYNRAGLLRETMASILAQENVPFEYLVIDDGSSDGTEMLVRGMNDPRVRYYRHENAGESLSVNRGWALARGTYVAVVSSDDPVLPGWLEASAAVLGACADVTVTYPDWRIIDAEGATIATVETTEFSVERALSCFHGIPGPGALIRRDAFAPEELPRNPAYRYAPDLDQWLRLASRGRFARIPHVLATWRRHDGSITESERTHAYADELLHLARAVYLRPGLPPALRALESYTLSRAAYLAAVVIESRSPWRAHRLMRRSYRLQPADHPSTPLQHVRRACPTRRDTLMATREWLGRRSSALFRRTPA